MMKPVLVSLNDTDCYLELEQNRNKWTRGNESEINSTRIYPFAPRRERDWPRVSVARSGDLAIRSVYGSYRRLRVPEPARIG